MFFDILFSALLHTMPPCPHEDSSNCSWDASRYGNAIGLSFVTLGDTVIYENGGFRTLT